MGKIDRHDSAARKERVYIGADFEDVAQMPDLISVQTDSYRKFLQADKVGTKEGPDPSVGLESVFRSVFPIEVGDYRLEYLGYSLDFDCKKLNLNQKECKKRGLIYSVPVKATLRLVNRKDATFTEKEVFFGDLPLMTERGSFIINGAERVVVSQVHRSPGVIAQYEKGVYSSRIIPSRGSWLEFEIDDKHKTDDRVLVYAKIDRKKRILVTMFLRAMGLGGREEIISSFYKPEKCSLDSIIAQDAEVVYSYRNVVKSSGTKVLRAGDEVTPSIAQNLKEDGCEEIDVVSLSDPDSLSFMDIVTCLEEEDMYVRREEGEDEPSETIVMHEVLQAEQRTEMQSLEKSRESVRGTFFSEDNYDLGDVGVYKFNMKFYPPFADGNENPAALKGRVLRVDDLVRVVKFLINVFHEKEPVDDIDHLGNRRVRCVGELLENQVRAVFIKMTKGIKEKMANFDTDKLKLNDLISTKQIYTAVNQFFQTSQLSQFMDQINPLSELTHKRRITALGPGGLNRERASFEVRDVHYTHYGRMCPIETPEGQNIGLIVTLANYTKINEFGFLQTPYRRVVDGKVTKEIRFLDADEEDHYYIAQGSAAIEPVDGGESSKFKEDEVPVRMRGNYSKQSPDKIQYMDVSPRQVISVAASLIPFLEHDDANRALMGSNMQRQAVPLLFPEAPRVGTGMEGKAAYDSGVLIKAKRAGKVTFVSSTEIRIKPDGKGAEDIYSLEKNIRTNQDTCFNQRPIVSNGRHVEAGEVIADGPATDNGELALGRNILVGFMPWNGYNYEDAVLISERVVKEDLYTSVHISEFTTDVRETKLGVEQLTRDIPNISAESVKNLNEDGIIMIGSHIKSGDILVGKVTPKADADLSPELKLMMSIFGSKQQEVKNSSLKVPHGTEGVVVGIERLSRENGDELPASVEETVKVKVANKRKLRPGDKMAGRHGNKGVVSRILPVEDMPYMEDGTPLDVCLNPLGVPSRMNIGQLLETELGWAAVELDEWYNSPVFQSASKDQIEAKLKEAGLPITSKKTLYDGRTGEKFVNDVFCGYIYYLKLNHLVEDKVHARSTGNYALVTQQPLGGRAQFGGQRFGEMEVWALEAYGAVNTLQEILTIKSDSVNGRVKAYESIVKGELATSVGTPEAFSVLLQEVRGLGIDMQVYDSKGKQVPLTERDEELLKKKV